MFSRASSYLGETKLELLFALLLRDILHALFGKQRTMKKRAEKNKVSDLKICMSSPWKENKRKDID